MDLLPDWVVTLGVAAIAATGAFAGALAVMRKSSRDDRQALIDQLQEERNASETRAAQDRAAFTAQIDRFWVDKSASRDHVAALRDHIWQRLPPPPPAPPEGYIP